VSTKILGEIPRIPFLNQNLGAFLALCAKNRAFRSKSSEAPMRFLWAFRYNPGCMGEQRICECKFATSPLRSGGSEPGQEIACGNFPGA
jgi:hypothetical protein